MPKGTTYAGDLLKLVLNGTPIANIADNAATAPLTSLYLGLYAASPAGASQSTSEVSYTGYARVAINRTGSGWTVTGSSASPNASITFGTKTGGTDVTATHVGIGTASSGSGYLIWHGPLSTPIDILNAVAPQLTTSSTITEA